MSEAFTRASERWPHAGVPNNPAGWLYTAASRLIIGRIRAEEIAGRKAQLLAVGAEWVDPSFTDPMDALADERLALILLCCHPAVHPEARSPLALRLVIGTPTDEIARLFLVPPATMAARITRAKRSNWRWSCTGCSPAHPRRRRHWRSCCCSTLAGTLG